MTSLKLDLNHLYSCTYDDKNDFRIFSVTYWVIIDEDVVGFVINGFLKLTNCWKLSVLFPEKELELVLRKPFFRQIICVFFLFLYQLGHEGRKPVFG